MLRLPPTFAVAVAALWRNLVRSALTTFGIVIGVGAMIAIVEIGQGSKKSVAETIQSLGANNLLILPGQASSGGVSYGVGSTPTLTPEDVVAIRKEVPGAVAVAPVVRVRTQIIGGGKNWVPIFIYGTTLDFLAARDWPIAAGRSFTVQESDTITGVCLIGQTVARELFGSPAGALQQTIRMNNTPLVIIGVLDLKGANTFGSDQDDVIVAPWRTIKFKVSGQSAQTGNQSATVLAAGTVVSSTTRYPSQQPTPYPLPSATQAADFPAPPLPTFVDQIVVRIGSDGELPMATQQIRMLLRERHRLQSEPDDFMIRDTAEMARTAVSLSELMSGLLLAVALVSLVVGGVGIMNIMLVSVTERTREIGLRMAVGARPSDILAQFLVEAVVLCVAGGFLGILLGWSGSWAVRTFMNWRTESSALAVFAAVGVSAFVGIAFGFYPAWKASRLDPIDALRYE